MRQRLGLAVALVGEPRLLILDEPTNALDPVGIAGMRALFGQLASRGTTVLVCSHLLAELELMCDRVAVMSDGHLLADGSLESLLADAATLHRDSHSTQPSLEDAFLTLTNKEIR
jgi:ABC-2 type transport system ATP-binding protein